MKNILITGGSGLIGQRLTHLLKEAGYEVAWLSRNPDKQTTKSYFWDIPNRELDPEALKWCDGIVHLAGAGVAEKRWTSARKKLILESRTDTARLLFDRLRTMEKRPTVIVSASGVNYYGLDNGDKWCYEESPAGNDYLAEVCQKWEAAVKRFESLGLRTVSLRTGVVLDKNGGALPELLKPPVAAPLGSGEQYMSWIHIEDLAQMYCYALTHENVTGAYNAVATDPVSNRELTRKAAKAKGKPYINFPVPGFALRLVLGEMAAMVLGSNRISPDKMISAGFHFKYTQIDHALKNILGDG